MITKFNDPQVNSIHNSTGNNNLLHSFLMGLCQFWAGQINYFDEEDAKFALSLQIKTTN